ncbi:MAG: SwmB domain-containing protein [Bacteroidales bacterium]
MPVLSFLKPSANSQLRGAGAVIGGLTTDAAGNAWQNPPSLGAYEYASGGNSAPIPVFSSAAVQNATPSLLEMTYSLTLANIVPAASSFSVLVNSVARKVNSVTISGNKVQLTLSSAIKYGDIITVAYIKPATNPLQTAAGDIATSISGQLVTNNLIDPNKDAGSVTITMTVSPNHVQNILNILLAYSVAPTSAISPEIIRISDLSGNLFIDKEIVTGATNVIIPLNLASGIYNILVLAGEVEMASQKIIVY